MASLNLWTEGILFSLAFVAIFTLVVVDMNVMYNQNNVVPFTDESNAENLFIEYQDTSATQIKGGQVDFTNEGITLKSAFGIAIDVMNIIWNFISGGWITQIVSKMNLGNVGIVLSYTLRTLYFLSLVFGMLYGLFKVIL